MGWWIFGSDESESNDEEEEQEEDEYPKGWTEEQHVKIWFNRTHATVHYKDDSTESVVYDVREDTDRTIKVAKYDPETDFGIRELPAYTRWGEPRVHGKKKRATEDQKTFNLDSVKKVEVSYVDRFVAFADVEIACRAKKDHRGRVESRALLNQAQDEIDWSYMIDYEYEAMREREEDN